MKESAEQPRLAPYNPSASETIRIALSLLNLTKNDIIVDLGCGDGRFLTAAAAATGARCVGVEYDVSLVERAVDNIRQSEVEHLVSIYQEDASKFDLSCATAIYLYLLPNGITEILNTLENAYARGVRIVTNMFTLPSLEPSRIETYKGTKIYLYSQNA